jgi:hypothetical protein
MNIDLSLPIDNLMLTNRAINSLKSDNIYTILELTKLTKNQVMKIPELGRNTFNHIENKLYENNLSFADSDCKVNVTPPWKREHMVDAYLAKAMIIDESNNNDKLNRNWQKLLPHQEDAILKLTENKTRRELLRLVALILKEKNTWPTK